MPTPLQRLRADAIARTLFPPTTLAGAVARLGFVQADPIRAPAPAQDLILRHRVKGYRAGDLERRYPELDLEEDTLYAYGFVRRDLWRAIQPRATRRLSALERRVLAVVRELGEAHPNDVAARLGHGRVVNAWGGHSKATTHALDALQYAGRLRVARRERGIRVYAVAPAQSAVPRARRERLRALVLLVVTVLAPASERTVRANIARFRRLGDPRAALDELVRRGELERARVEGVDYLSPRHAGVRVSRSDPAPRWVRFLAPFDPLVWDRARFEHLFGWSYRFEAYTPASKRVRGYYAMPLLWRDRVVGWANASRSAADEPLDVAMGWAAGRPREVGFAGELEAEIERLRGFVRARRPRPGDERRAR